jgi:hypothetical protein
MLQKLETVLEDSKNYRLEECVIDSLMRLDSDCSNCTKCQYAICDIEEEGMICEIELIDELSGVV